MRAPRKKSSSRKAVVAPSEASKGEINARQKSPQFGILPNLCAVCKMLLSKGWPGHKYYVDNLLANCVICVTFTELSESVGAY